MKDTMTIDKAIEIHRGLKDIAEKHNIMIGAFYNTKEHEQIAEWLEELKRLQAEIAELQNERQADCAFMGEYEKCIRNETIDDVFKILIKHNVPYQYKAVREILLLKEENIADKHKMTNIDKIRTMSNEELADFIHNIGSYTEDGNPYIEVYIEGNKTILDDNIESISHWLKSEAEE